MVKISIKSCKEIYFLHFSTGNSEASEHKILLVPRIENINIVAAKNMTITFYFWVIVVVANQTDSQRDYTIEKKLWLIKSQLAKKQQQQ